MNTTLNPYLNFNGNTAEAMQFYHSILGGDLKMQTLGEADMSKGPETESRIMHAFLRNDLVMLMASDGMPGMEVIMGNNVSLSLNGSEADGEKLTEVFNKLAEGGKITMPLAPQFWGDTFGMLTDKFGVHWMVDFGKGMPT
jgi:PhnB protein